MERYDGVSLNCTCLCDLALAIERCKLGLCLHDGSAGGEHLIERGKEVVALSGLRARA